MSKRISKETRKRLKRNRHRRYKRKMALRNQPRTTQEKADVAAEAMRWDDSEDEGITVTAEDDVIVTAMIGGVEGSQVVPAGSSRRFVSDGYGGWVAGE